MRNIVPCLWFDGKAEEAANFYVATFTSGGRQARIVDELRHGDAGPGPKGSILTMTFELEGQTFVALNGNAQNSFTHAVSFMVNCPTQAEIDYFWGALGAGGAPVACGWLTDRYGLSWQVVPPQLLDYLKSQDEAAAERAMRAMMQMVKLDLPALEAAYRG